MTTQNEQDITQPYHNLTPETVLDAVESIGYVSDARTLALNSYENRVYQVGIEDEAPIIVKFYRPERWSDDQILEEHQFTQQLFESELPVVPPLANSQGETLFTYKTFRFSLFKRMGGHAPDLTILDNLSTLGRCLGRMHSIGSLKPFSARPTLSTETFGHKSRSFLLNSNFIPAYLETQYADVTLSLLNIIDGLFTTNQSQTIRLHGDCHPGNILWREGAPHFVDFDDSRNGLAMQDLWMLLSGDRHQRQTQLMTVAQSYNEFYYFDSTQIALVEGFRALRLMHYAAWLARRWEDPAFPQSFTWFNTSHYWQTHINDLREQILMLEEPPLVLY